MRRVLLLVLLVSSMAACAHGGGSATASGSEPPDGRHLVDCDASPLLTPTFDLEGVEVPQSGHVRLSGGIDAIVQTGEQVEIALRAGQSALVTIRLDLGQPVPVDLLAGTVIDIDYWQRQGFEGTARGIRIRDESGLVLLADDGDYGNAMLEEDLEPFTVAQTDAGCRNRENAPGDLNNFKLVVSAGESSVELIHGETGNLTLPSSEYTVWALRSVARVGDVVWTDAPAEYMSFVIARVPLA